MFHVYSTYNLPFVYLPNNTMVWLKVIAQGTRKGHHHSYVTGCHRMDVILLMKIS